MGRYLVAARDIEPLELVLWDRWVPPTWWVMDSIVIHKWYPSNCSDTVWRVIININGNNNQLCRAAAVGPGADTLPVCLECFKRVEPSEGGR